MGLGYVDALVTETNNVVLPSRRDDNRYMGSFVPCGWGMGTRALGHEIAYTCNSRRDNNDEMCHNEK